MEDSIRAVRDLLTGHAAHPLAMVQSFGCQLNMTDGEKLKGLLLSMGYALTDDPADADLILFNTCAVREHAEERVFGRLGALKQYKRQKPELLIGLCGCMTAEEATIEKLRASYPFVSLVVGTGALERLPVLLLRALQGEAFACDATVQDIPAEGLTQVRTSSITASVPIMFGCNNFCTYCIVPYVRGRERSRAPDAIYEEVKALVAAGYREIFLLGQNVNSYGNDLPDGIRFPALLRMLDGIEGDYILRFMSSHPKDAGTELIDAICDCSHVEKHLHLPVQSGSDEILAAMNRRYTVARYREIVDYARSRIPDFSLTSDIIVGFPNETDAQFRETLTLLETIRYDNVYAFIYSKRTGTKAAMLPDATPEAEKTSRMRELLALQREIASVQYKRFLGRTLRVLVEGVGKRGAPWLTGKSPKGVIVELQGDPACIGNFVSVRITETKNWAVVGEVC